MLIFSEIAFLWLSLLTGLSSWLYTRSRYQRKVAQLEERIHIDRMTGLKSSFSFQEDLPRYVSEAQRSGNGLCIIMLDIDNFKNLNTRLGYQTANEILAEFGRRLGSDNRSGDEAYRYFARGDEFVVMLQNTTLVQGLVAARRKDEHLTQGPYSVDAQYLQIQCTWSVAALEPLESADEFICRAEGQLLQAKANRLIAKEMH